MQAREAVRQGRIGQTHASVQVGQPQRRVAGTAREPDIIPDFGAIAPQGKIRRHGADHGDGDIARPARGVAADQLHAESVGQPEEALRELREPGFVGLRQSQGQGRIARCGAHGGEIRQIHRQSLVPQLGSVGAGEKMPPFDQHVGGYR